MIANSDSFGNDSLTPDVATIPNVDRSTIIRGLPARYCPPHGIVCINLNTGADATVITDRQVTRAIEQSMRANPGILTNMDVPIDVTAVVNTTILSKTKGACPLPPIEEQFFERQITLPARPHLRTKLLVESLKLPYQDLELGVAERNFVRTAMRHTSAATIRH